MTFESEVQVKPRTASTDYEQIEKDHLQVSALLLSGMPFVDAIGIVNLTKRIFKLRKPIAEVRHMESGPHEICPTSEKDQSSQGPFTFLVFLVSVSPQALENDRTTFCNVV